MTIRTPNVIRTSRTKGTGPVSITGLTNGDLLLLARAIRAGSVEGGDQGGKVSGALVRFAQALEHTSRHTSIVGNIALTGNGAPADELYERVAS